MMKRRIRDCIRLYHTLKHVSFHQLWTRLRRLLRHRWFQVFHTQLRVPRSITRRAGIAGLWRAPEAEEAAALRVLAIPFMQGEFTFVGHTESFNGDIDWNLELRQVPRLWRFHLHYFEYLQPLICGHEKERACGTALMQAWMRSHTRLQAGDGYHPYTLSRRIVQWVEALLYLRDHKGECAAVSDTLVVAIERHLRAQAEYLYTDLEFDLRGNHLLANLKALIWAGIYFDDSRARRWCPDALQILKSELEEQVLADGGHFERTPSYHWLVISDLLEIRIWLQRNLAQHFLWLDRAIQKMIDFGITLLPRSHRHGFKEPLLKDSAWGAAPSPQVISHAAAVIFAEPHFIDAFAPAPKLSGLDKYHLRCLLGEDFDTWDAQTWVPKNNADADGAKLLAESGFWVVRNPDSFFVADVGKPGPDYLPGHAHADALSFELHASNGPLFTDSGTYTYNPGPWRNYFRGTAAHNTVVLGEQHQSDIYDAFRIGKRANTRVLGQWHDVQHQVSIDGLCAEHYGYRRLHPDAVHRRHYFIFSTGVWVVVDSFLGDVSFYKPKTYLHAHPGLSVSYLTQMAVVDLGDVRSAKQVSGAVETVDSGWQPLSGTLHFDADVSGLGWQYADTGTPTIKMRGLGFAAAKVHRGREYPMGGWYSPTFGQKMPRASLELSWQDRMQTVFALGLNELPELSWNKNLLCVGYGGKFFELESMFFHC